MGILDRQKTDRIEPENHEPGITGSGQIPRCNRKHLPSSTEFTSQALIQKPCLRQLCFKSQHLQERSQLCKFLLRSSSALIFGSSNPIPSSSIMLPVASALSAEVAASEAMRLIQSSPATWESALFCNMLIFIAGSPILVTGLSVSGIGAAFLLGTLTWRAFGASGFLLVATYFIIVRSISQVPQYRSSIVTVLRILESTTSAA